ncbi:hypothetical protein CRV08_14805 [Halarcobacter ebronensis]|uniref:Histidine kinase n=1 Tax=Halarcobacter ebronensis TaxID=1462615 RepID=A0A4Q0Y642_9BACT|nr:FIST C-terminal domain-containing protein [Halarcobacter ebronensis]RXJ65636.1 hypothetical protein CRV08_14805 [Halarcobacter ebronensis]
MKTIKYYEKLKTFIDTNRDKNAEYLLLVGENTDFDIELLKESNINFKGAIVPQIVYEDFNSDSGIVACELTEDSDTIFIEDITNIDLKKEDFTQYDSVILVVDGLSKHLTTFLESIFHLLPIDCEIVGGGAGKMTLKQEPVIFSKDGILQDAAILIAGKQVISVGVENGWEYLEGPFIVTSAEKNLLKSLNFSNAFDVYKSIVEESSGLKFNEEQFFNIAKSYPLGIIRFNKEIVVRDAIGLDENGNIILIGDIEQNSTINFLTGKKDKLINSSSFAIKNALKKIKDKDNIKNIIIFDCISRKEFLEKDFKKELAVIKDAVPTKRVFGALSLGEIANSGNEYINFYNRTCVVGVLC